MKSPLQPLAFWALGVLFYCTVTLVVQWRGLNGSLGWVWQAQHVAVVLCFILWHLVAVCEYRRGWVEAALRAVFGADVDICALASLVRVWVVILHFFSHPFTHLAVVMRSMKECSSTDALSTIDIIYCNSPIE